MRQHSESAEGKNASIEVCSDGYILSFKQRYQHHKKVFTTFDALTSFIAYLFHLKGAFPETKVVEVDRDDCDTTIKVVKDSTD